MIEKTPDQLGWNIFARELAAILHARGLRLGHLNDQAGIHPARVSRLQRSLREPKFNMLPPEDLEHVMEVFEFSPDEQVRMKAAILATAIENILMGRINQLDALQAVDQIFPILCRALREQGDSPSGIGAVKTAGALEATSPEMEAQLEVALNSLDNAVLAQYLAKWDKNARDQRRNQRLAREQFRAALDALDALPPSARELDEWLVWHTQALQGLAATERAILDTGNVSHVS